MRGHLAHALVSAVVLLLSLTAAAPAMAQTATPAKSGARTSWVGTPPSSDCTVEPLGIDALVDALAPTAAPSDPEEFPLDVASEADLPTGEPADPDMVDAASADFWEAAACINAGDFPRFFASFTPEGLNGLVLGFLTASGRAPGPLTEQELTELEANVSVAFAATPVPLAGGDQARIDAIRDARMLPDGRLLFVVDGTVTADASLYVVFRLVDDRWLIDAIGQIGYVPA
jgi:hypothetical protein